jgi:cytochrome c-type biogenesis protein
MLFDVSYGGAALAGILSFFSPCVLPMVPFYFCYMAGVSMNEIKDGGIAPGAQRRLVISAVFFALGVTTIFTLLGATATALGQAFRDWKDILSYAAAGLIFVFGIHFLGLIRIPFLMREAKFESKSDPTKVIGAYVMGLAFGFGWSACVGPVLAAILMMAAGQDTMLAGTLLVFVYGASMTVPFVIASLFATPFLAWMQRNRKYMGYVEKVMGALLILFAVLIATNTLNYIGEWMIQNFDWTGTLK